jgi:hypothetical protein
VRRPVSRFAKLDIAQDEVALLNLALPSINTVFTSAFYM